MGIEQDPRHPELFRIFIEHRNQILEDMIVCECTKKDHSRMIVHQEIFDAGGEIIFRVVLLHWDGDRKRYVRQAAVLQVNSDQFDGNGDDMSIRTTSFQMVEDLSLRFPIQTSRSDHTLLPGHRIMVYTSVPYEPKDDESDPPDGDRHPMTPALVQGEVETDRPAEDFHSVGGGGGYSDVEAEPIPDTSTDHTVAWRRPLVESIVLLKGLEDPPFKVFPMSMA